MTKKNFANQSLASLNVEYKPREKFEINSLNAIVCNLINQLVLYKRLLCRKYLKDFKDKTPYFQQVIDKHEREKMIQTNNIQTTITYMKNS